MSAGIRIKDLPKSERPRERLVELGADALNSSELIAILLRTGTKGCSAVEAAQQLVTKFGSLNALSQASLEDLQVTPGVGPDKAIALKSAFTLARRMARELQGESPVLDNPASIADYLREQNREYEVEHFQVVMLNTRRKLIRLEVISQGLVDTLLAHPREVFRAAIAANASAVVLAHNLCAATHKLCYVEHRFMCSYGGGASLVSGLGLSDATAHCSRYVDRRRSP
jgi:DNA repair protein RadC